MSPCPQRLSRLKRRPFPSFRRRLFTRGGYNEGTHHLHFTVHGSPTWAEPILLRDYLRAHPEAAARYERVKRDSAAEHGSDLNGYHDQKSPCVTALMERAKAWDPERVPDVP